MVFFLGFGGVFFAAPESEGGHGFLGVGCGMLDDG